MSDKVNLVLRSHPNSNGLYPLVADFINDRGKRQRKNVPDVYLEQHQWNEHYQAVELSHPRHLLLNNRINSFTKQLVTEFNYEVEYKAGELTLRNWLYQGLKKCKQERSRNGLKPLQTAFNKVIADQKFASIPLIELTDKDVSKHFLRAVQRSRFTDSGKNYKKRLRELFNASMKVTNIMSNAQLSDLFRRLPSSFPAQRIRYVPESSSVREWFDLLLAGERDNLPCSAGRALSFYLFSMINAGMRPGDMFKLKPSNLSVFYTEEGHPMIAVNYTMSKTGKNMVMQFDAFDGRDLSFSLVFAFLIRYDSFLSGRLRDFAPLEFELLNRHIARLELKKRSRLQISGEIHAIQKIVIDIIVLFDKHKKQLEEKYLFLFNSSQVDSKLAVLNAALNFFDERLTSYSARHLYAIMLRENSEDVYMIKERLGHANVKYTEVYLTGLKSKPFEPISILNL